MNQKTMINEFYLQAYVVLLTKCNLRCSHCIRRFTENPNDIIAYVDVVSIFDSIYKNNPNTHLILTGGEPTLHPDFFKILSYVNKLFNNVTICSNGIYDYKFLEKLCEYPNINVQISIDGNNKYHNLIRGDCNFEKSMNTIQVLTQHNIKTIVSTTVNKLNINSIIELRQILTHYKIKKWQIEMEQAFSEKESKKMLTVKEWNNFVDSIMSKCNIPIAIKKLYDFDLFKKMEDKYGKPFLKKIANPNCGCCKSKFYIYPNKTVRMCTCLEDTLLGDLNKESLNEIVNKFADKRQILNVKEKSPCYTCEWLYICNGGCPGYSNYIFKGFGFGDIRCPKVKEYYGL